MKLEPKAEQRLRRVVVEMAALDDQDVKLILAALSNDERQHVQDLLGQLAHPGLGPDDPAVEVQGRSEDDPVAPKKTPMTLSAELPDWLLARAIFGLDKSSMTVALAGVGSARAQTVRAMLPRVRLTDATSQALRELVALNPGAAGSESGSVSQAAGSLDRLLVRWLGRGA